MNIGYVFEGTEEPFALTDLRQQIERAKYSICVTAIPIQGPLFESLEQNNHDLQLFLLDASLCQPLAEESHHLSDEVRRYLWRDVLMHFDKGYWSRSYFHQGLQSALSKKGLSFKVDGQILLFGAEKVSFSGFWTMAKFGFKKYTLVEESQEKADFFLQQVNGLMLAGQIQVIHPRQIPLLPGVFSVALNSFSIETENQYTDELSYFNYLQKGGVFVDLVEKDQRSLLLESDKIGALRVDYKEIIVERNRVFLQKLLSGDVR